MPVTLPTLVHAFKAWCLIKQKYIRLIETSSDISGLVLPH